MSKRLDLLCVLLIYCLDAFGIALVYPIFTSLFFGDSPFFLVGESSDFYKTFILGALISIFPIAQFFGAPFIGDFSDKIGRKKTLTFTIAMSAITYFTTAFGIFFHSLPLVFFSRMISGFFAGNTSICLATLSDLSAHPKDRSKNFGILAACGGLSFLLSIGIGEYVSEAFSPGLPFGMIGIAAFCIWFITLFFFQDIRPHVERSSFSFSRGCSHILSGLKYPHLKHAYLVYFFFGMTWSSAMQFYPLTLLERYGESSIGMNLLTIGVMWSFANFFVQRKLAAIATPHQILKITVPILGCFLLSFFLPQTYLSFSIHFSVTTFFAALIWTNAIAHVSMQAPLEIQGRILGINQSFSSLSSVIGALIGGLCAAFYPEGVFLFGLFSVACCFYFLHRENKSS